MKSHIQFMHYDFHGFCRGDRYHQLKIMLGKISQGLTDFGFLVEDKVGKKIHKF